MYISTTKLFFAYIIVTFFYLFLAIGETLLKGNHKFVLITGIVSGVCLLFVLVLGIGVFDKLFESTN